MAGANWDLVAFNEKNETTDGQFLSSMGVRVEIYKNWLYVHDEKAWEEGAYLKPVIMEIHEGQLVYKDVKIFALRGPQDGVFVVAYENEDSWMAGCGVYGFSDNGDWIGVAGESVLFLERLIKDHDLDIEKKLTRDG